MDPSIKKRFPNINPDTDVPYGVIALDKLDQDVVDQLMFGPQAKNLTYEEAKEDFLAEARRSDEADGIEFDEQFEIARFEQQYEGNEEVYAGEYEGIQYQTFWLGGAPHLFVFKSPVQRLCRPCSPCVPNAGDLSSKGGYVAYDVHPEWRAGDA